MADFNMTREKAIKYAEAMNAKIQEKIEFYRRGNAHATEVYYSDFAFLSAAISALREQEERRWISVTERLPDWRDGKVLVFTKYGFSICERTVNNRWRGQHANWITHWAYLPQPPKGE